MICRLENDRPHSAGSSTAAPPTYPTHVYHVALHTKVFKNDQSCQRQAQHKRYHGGTTYARPQADLTQSESTFDHELSKIVVHKNTAAYHMLPRKAVGNIVVAESHDANWRRHSSSKFAVHSSRSISCVCELLVCTCILLRVLPVQSIRRTLKLVLSKRRFGRHPKTCARKRRPYEQKGSHSRINSNLNERVPTKFALLLLPSVCPV